MGEFSKIRNFQKFQSFKFRNTIEQSKLWPEWIEISKLKFSPIKSLILKNIHTVIAKSFRLVPKKCSPQVERRLSYKWKKNLKLMDKTIIWLLKGFGYHTLCRCCLIPLLSHLSLNTGPSCTFFSHRTIKRWKSENVTAVKERTHNLQRCKIFIKYLQEFYTP